MLFGSKPLKICAFICFISMVSAFPSSDENNDCSNYCQNDGICVVIKNQRQCYCLPEWEGEFCEIERESETIQIDSLEFIQMSSSRTHACSLAPPNLCNGGLCQFENSKFSCACPSHLIGTRCELQSPCNNYCRNEGICSIENDEPKCNCTELFAGTICHLPVTVPPENTTTTPPTTTTPHALCKAYQDEFCKTGTCAVVNGRLTCQCPPTHTGEFCDIEKAATSGPGTAGPGTAGPGTAGPGTPGPGTPGPSTAGPGTVNPGGNSDDACSSNPCQNNRPCYNNGNTFYCFCGNGFTGPTCATASG